MTSAVSILLLGSALIVVFAKDIKVSVIAMSGFGMILSLYYAILHAPDVAITQAALGTGLSTLVFVLVLHKTKGEKKMANLLKYLQADSIYRISAKKHDDILKEIIEKTLREKPDEILQKAFHGIRTNSGVQEINLGHGFALSHHRMDDVNDINLSIGIVEKKVRYFKGPPVKAIFCVILPDAKSREYLSLMAKLTRFLSLPGTPGFFEHASPEEVFEKIRIFEEG